MRICAMGLPEVAGHPNRLEFEGVLTLLDTPSDRAPSDRAPSGARGHRVILTAAAAGAALPSLIGMGVDFKAGFDGHDARQKIGIITGAEISDSKVLVNGYLFERDYPEIQQLIRKNKGKLGMSYELADAHVQDMRAGVWTLTKATFTGAAVLLRDKAAYRETSFCLRPIKTPNGTGLVEMGLELVAG